MAISKSIKEYEIDVVGKMCGVDIPINHRYVVKRAMVLGNDMDDTYHLIMGIATCADSSHSAELENDLLEGGELKIDLGATKPTSAIATLVKNKLEAWMNAEATIGSGNWTEIS